MITRRHFLYSLASAPALLSANGFTQSPPHRIAMLFGGPREGNEGFLNAFREQLAALGYVEGLNLVLDVRFGSSSQERANQFSEELLALHPKVFLALQGRALGAASRLPASVPVIGMYSGNPVDAGYAVSFARPGRNMTGISLMAVELVGKRIELLKEILPRLKTIAIIADPQHSGEHRERAASEAAAKIIGLRVLYYPVGNEAELSTTLSAAKAAGAEGIVAFPDGVTAPNRSAIADFSIRNRIPVVAGWASFVEAGCLLSYGPNLRSAYARAAYFVDRIIKGAKPADLPIELPTVVELAVNRKTARSLGIDIPNSILVRADKVIE